MTSDSPGGARFFDPEDVAIEFLVEKLVDADASRCQPPPRFEQFGLLPAIVEPVRDFRQAFFEGEHRRRRGGLDESRSAHSEFPGRCAEPARALDGEKKIVERIEDGDGELHAFAVHRRGQESLVRPRIVKPLDLKPQSALREIEPELPGGDVLERVCLVEDEEIVRKKKSVAASGGRFLVGIRHEREEERVVDDDHVRLADAPPGFLVKAPPPGPAPARRARVRLAANLRPDLWVRCERKRTQRPVRGLARPLSQQLHLFEFRTREEVVRLPHRAFEPPRTEVVLTAFEQDRFEWRLLRQHVLEGAGYPCG